MAKKHRVKRQKYVEHLLNLEKTREDYLEKRRAPKRSREVRNNEEAVGEGRDQMEQKALKKRRTESTAVAAGANMSEEEEEQQQTRDDNSQPLTRAFRASASATAAVAVAGAGAAAPVPVEKKSFFSGASFTDLVKASSAAAGKKAVEGPAKKSLKRKHY